MSIRGKAEKGLATWITDQMRKHCLTGSQVSMHLNENGVRASAPYIYRVAKVGMSYRKAKEIANAMGWELPKIEDIPVVKEPAEGNPVQHMEDDEEVFIRSIQVNSEELPTTLALYQMKDDSMEPTVSPQDTLLLDTSRTELNSDGLYLIKYYDSTLLRRIQYIPGEGYRAISDNQIYEPFPLQITKVEVKARVIGKLSFFTL